MLAFLGEEERRKRRCNSEELIANRIIAVGSKVVVRDDEVDGSGTVVVNYTYDAWGKLQAMTVEAGAGIGIGADIEANINGVPVEVGASNIHTFQKIAHAVL